MEIYGSLMDIFDQTQAQNKHLRHPQARSANKKYKIAHSFAMTFCKTMGDFNYLYSSDFFICQAQWHLLRSKPK